jgi:hypothetical protein
MLRAAYNAKTTKTATALRLVKMMRDKKTFFLQKNLYMSEKSSIFAPEMNEGTRIGSLNFMKIGL